MGGVPALRQGNRGDLVAIRHCPVLRMMMMDEVWPVISAVIAGLDPRLSGSIFLDKAHGVDSSVFQAFGDVLGHGEGSSHAASE